MATITSPKFPSSFRHIWQQLSHGQKSSLGLLVFLGAVAIPLSVWSSNQAVRDRSQAYVPISPPITPTTDCRPINKVIYVYPPEIPGCHDLQKAIDAVPSSDYGYTIRLMPGDYFVPDTNNSFSLVVSNKQNLTIEGSHDQPSRAVTLHFPQNHGGISFDNASGHLSWMQIKGQTANGLIYIQNTTRFTMSYLHLEHQGANTVGVGNSREIAFTASDLIGGVNGFHVSSTANFNISNSFVNVPSSALTAYQSSGKVVYSRLEGNGESGIHLYAPLTFDIHHNTIVKNAKSNPGYAAGIDLANLSSLSPVKIEKNIIVDNSVGLKVANSTSDGSKPNPVVWYNNVYGNTTNYHGLPDQTGSNGNISKDPLFGPTDYCLLPGSPSILENGEYMGHRGPCGSVTPTPRHGNGDMDHNGYVDARDNALLRRSYGQSGTVGMPGDLVPNGKVDLFDFNALLFQYGRPASPALTKAPFPTTNPSLYPTRSITPFKTPYPTKTYTPKPQPTLIILSPFPTKYYTPRPIPTSTPSPLPTKNVTFYPRLTPTGPVLQ